MDFDKIFAIDYSSVLKGIGIHYNAFILKNDHYDFDS